jgi:hypothetical protein
MSTASVTIIVDTHFDTRKREIELRVADALAALGGERSERPRWFVIAHAARPAPASDRGAIEPASPVGRRIAALDYATWHARLAGDRTSATLGL